MKRTCSLYALVLAGLLASSLFACHTETPCCPPQSAPCEPAPEGLLGVTLEKPIIGFNSSGRITLHYLAEEGLLVADATALVLVYNGAEVLMPIGSVTLHLETKVLRGGAAVGGVPGDDLVLEGTIDLDDDGNPEYSGDLLRADILAMGFEKASDNLTLFDFTFEVEGGAMAGVFGGTAGMVLTCENSTFVSFCEDFDGIAKGNLGTTGAGGFCPRTPGYWKNHLSAWPVRWLTLGGVRYDSEALMRMLCNKTPDGQKAANDASAKLAKFMIAAKFNLLSGSPTADVVQTLVKADILLAADPPGSAPCGDLEADMLALKDLLDAYCNSQDCVEPCETSGDKLLDGDDADDDDGCQGAKNRDNDRDRCHPAKKHDDDDDGDCPSRGPRCPKTNLKRRCR